MSTMISVGDSLKNNDCTFEQRQRDIEALEKAEAKARKREQHSPFKNFIQVNMDPEICKVRRALMLECPKAYMIFDFLMENADGLNAVICSTHVLMEVLKLSKATVCRAINILKERRFIDVKKSGNANVYFINRELVWKSYGTNYKYAKFKANVIIAESEQDEDVKVKTRRMNLIELVDTVHNDEYDNDN